MPRPSYQTCTEVSPLCPVEATTYGYYPNLGGNAFLCAVFGLCGVIQLVLGIRYKTWTWALGLTSGCLLEMAGYVGRLMMHKNPWDSNGLKLQIVALVFSPSFIAAGIDLTLKHVALRFGKEWSRIRPSLYTWGFIGTDVFSIVIQAAGGGIAAAADHDVDLLNVGDNVIITGIAIQIGQLVVFGIVAAEYAYRLFRHRAELSEDSLAFARSFKFRWFITAVTISYFTILTRCIYRMPEMAGGWGNGLQRNEPLFLVLDGAMVAIAAVLLTLAHPGIFFPQLSSTYYRQQREAEKAQEEAAVSSG